MGLTKAQRQRAEREELERQRAEEEARVKRLEALFDALPEGEAKRALMEGMTDRIQWLYDNARFEEGDAILEFLPSRWSHQFLDWYFHESETHPAEAPSSKDEDHEPREVLDTPPAEGGADGISSSQKEPSLNK